MRPVCQDSCEVVIVRWENGDALQEISKSAPTERNGESRISFQGTQTRITCGSTADGPKTASSLSSSGETFLRKSMEGVIESHPYVDAVLIRDRGEAGLALLVQPQAAVPRKE